MGATVTVRRGADGAEFVTDEGNWVLDCAFGAIADPSRLAALLDRRAGIVEHGLFLGLATDLLVAGPAGVEHRTRP
jgi:ribose 5-phosphate isomerase A